jgi:5-methylcytosine-specific restriction enzyme A
MSLQEQLHNTMLEMYTRAGKETGYWGRRFLQSVKKNGGLTTAKRMLQPQPSTAKIKGLIFLANARRADLSLEYLVLQEPFRKLFSEMELTEAARRLRNLPKNSIPSNVPPDENFPETKSLPVFEGGRRRILVNTYERDNRARKACIEKWGTSCKVCGISFDKVYGLRGKDSFMCIILIHSVGEKKVRSSTQ